MAAILKAKAQGGWYGAQAPAGLAQMADIVTASQSDGVTSFFIEIKGRRGRDVVKIGYDVEAHTRARAIARVAQEAQAQGLEVWSLSVIEYGNDPSK